MWWKRKLTFWHISDTHGYHELLTIPKGIDVVIHSGDHSNYRDVYRNEAEAHNFLHWYSKLKIKYKVLIAGNHDALASEWNTKFRDLCKKLGIIYLQDESVTIKGIKIYGSPYTPRFGNWHFMKDRGKIDRVWQAIPEDTRILVVHGPPKGVLDSAHDFNNYIEQCGCGALMKRVQKIKPDYVLFGHIHNNNEIINAGTRTFSGLKTIFINASVVTDRKFGTLTSNGEIFKL